MEVSRMSLPTTFTDLVGCRVPIQLAPMGGGVVTTDLAIAVTRAGGLGMLQRSDAMPLAARFEALAVAGAEPFGVNFVLHGPGANERAEIEFAASRARLVEFFWAEPDPAVVGWVHRAGALAGWQVGSAAEATRAVDAGCDLIVAQGVEAGGHVRGTVGLLPLLADILDVVTVPVLAAGGITTARSMAAVLAAGAAGVRMGTRFLATPESGAHPDYVAALLAADGQATTLTEAFGVGWPDAPHRVLASALTQAGAFRGEVVARHGRQGSPIARFASQTPNREVEGSVEAMALYAGQGVGQVSTVIPAAQVVTDFTDEAERLLRRWTNRR
jgi:NAD(P)H-dependent flavin oxidoreductase YrpB (nitropropane dioxygenase family)